MESSTSSITLNSCREQADSHSALTDIHKQFIDAMPTRPRSCYPEDYSQQCHRSRNQALQYPQIQINSRNKKAFLVLDIDRRGAESAWEEAGLPAPTTIVMNPANGHAHLTWMLTTPVFSRPDRFSKPLAFYDRIRSDLIRYLERIAVTWACSRKIRFIRGG